MYPSSWSRRNHAARAEGVSECTFYWHATANDSEALVSHGGLESLLLMQLAVLRHALKLPEEEKMEETKGCETKDAAAAVAEERDGAGEGDGKPKRKTKAPVKKWTSASGQRLHVLRPSPLAQLPQRQREVMTRLNPLSLPDGAYLSMFSSLSDYTPQTRCHSTAVIPADKVLGIWLALVRCVCASFFSDSTVNAVEPSDGGRRQMTPWPDYLRFAPDKLPHAVAAAFAPLLNQNPRLTFGASLISGVYIHRLHHSDFELGIVTKGDRNPNEVTQLLSDVTRVTCVPFPFRNGLLPLGAALRRVSLEVWWTPDTQRVRPGVPLAPIEATVVERCYGAAPRPRRAATGIFHGYEYVAVVLTRPVTSRLQGRVRQVALPHSLDACKVEVMQRPRTQKQMAAAGRRLSNKATTKCCCSTIFTGLSVSTIGEHLLSVEVHPAKAYRPFLPTLCHHVIPFLAVPHNSEPEVVKESGLK